jgi:DNA polymerase-3 subunit delta'
VEKLRFINGEHLSHAYIVSSESEKVRNDAAAELAQALVCSGGGDRPCRSCRDCRKAAEGIHPDIITVERQIDENGTRKKEIYVDQVRYMVGDAYVLPNEAERKVYIVRDADTMNQSAQNAALKLLEEPPAAAAFILCAANPAMLLPTVRSRCAEFHFNAEDEGPSEEAGKLAEEFLRLVSGGKQAGLLSWCVKNEGMTPALARDFTEAAEEKLADMLCLRAPAAGMDRKQMADLMELLKKCREYLGVNTGVKHIFGLLAVDAVPDGKDHK